MRKGPGLAALDRSLQSSAQYTTLGNQLTTQQLADLRAQLETFSSALRTFSSRHRSDILRNAEFRHAFSRMCASIGVDPLGSAIPTGKKALWNDLLGLGDWQYQLGVQVIDVCVSTRELNGGLIEMGELIRRVSRLRTGRDTGSDAGGITEEDIIRSIKTLKPLGCGYEVVQLGDRKMVRSVPRQLGTDTMIVLTLLSLPRSPKRSADTVLEDEAGMPYLTQDCLRLAWPGKKAEWTAERARAVLDDLALREGMLWIDEQAYPVRYYSMAMLHETSAEA